MIELEFVGFNNIDGCVTVNGRLAKLKRKGSGAYTCNVNDTEGQCEIEIFKAHRYVGKGYIWWNLLFFFISVFGIFDVKTGKRFPVFHAKLSVSCETDGWMTLHRQDFEDGGRYVQFQSPLPIEEIINVQYYDVQAKRRHKRMNKIRLLAVAVTVLAAVVITLM